MASFLVRLVWFACIGPWASIIWLSFAVLFMLSVIGFPVGIVMLMKTWKIATLSGDPSQIVNEVTNEVSVNSAD
jgi:uncharacterized membrane protein YccF (DUF307 family)